MNEVEKEGYKEHLVAAEFQFDAHHMAAEINRLRAEASKAYEAVCQTLGRALGYPKFCDDQTNFPGATEADGVCVGDHVAESLATEAARRIGELRAAEAAAFRRGAEAMKLQVKAYCVALVLAGQRGEFGPEVDALPLPEDKR